MGEAPEAVKLETVDGGHVGWTQVPRFRPCIDVLLWGARIFRYRDVSPKGHLVYSEARAFTVRAPVQRPAAVAPPPDPDKA